MGGIGRVLLAVLGGRCGRDGARMGLRSAFGSAPLRGLLGGVSDALRFGRLTAGCSRLRLISGPYGAQLRAA